MLELLCRLQAISSFAKDCHYHFNEYSQHLLADVNEDDLEKQIDLINEVCYLGQGEEAPAKKDILAGALDYMAQPSTDEKENFAKLKLMIKECLVHLEQTEAKTRGANALLDNIAMTLQQLHGLLFKTVDDIKDIEYLNSLPDLMEEENYNESDEEKGEWITVKGSHIFIKDGESKEKAVKDFIAKKEKSESKEKRTPKDRQDEAKEIRDRMSDIEDEMQKERAKGPHSVSKATSKSRELRSEYEKLSERLSEIEDEDARDTDYNRKKEKESKKDTESKSSYEKGEAYRVNIDGEKRAVFVKEIRDKTVTLETSDGDYTMPKAEFEKQIKGQNSGLNKSTDEVKQRKIRNLETSMEELEDNIREAKAKLKKLPFAAHKEIRDQKQLIKDLESEYDWAVEKLGKYKEE